jgi:uncharacterized protein YbgA (DUF1722 family)/uncharacterized protein YbbK (DUF523 family)
MSRDFSRPKVFSSKCLGFAACRWNGVSIPDRFIDSLKPYVDFVTTCPEVEIGLGVPRDPIRIVFKNEIFSLMQFNTKKEVSGLMTDFAEKFLDSVDEVDGFILKDRSPSCGIKGVKVYPGLEKSNVVEKTSGFFAKEVIKRFPHQAIESEARLSNYNIREHFLTKLFTIAKFRTLKAKCAMRDLVQFHAENKLLLMACSQKELKIMGQIVANHEKKEPKQVFKQYETHLSNALGHAPKYKGNINVIMHAFGYFSKNLSSKEKQFFLNSLEEYRREQVPLSVPLRLLRADIIRFETEYLSQQTFFEPYPVDLVEVTDSGKGRTY